MVHNTNLYYAPNFILGRCHGLSLYFSPCNWVLKKRKKYETRKKNNASEKCRKAEEKEKYAS